MVLYSDMVHMWCSWQKADDSTDDMLKHINDTRKQRLLFILDCYSQRPIVKDDKAG
jgi:hypothetical protein